MDQPQARKPKNIFEQIVFGLEVTNANIVDLYRKVEEIHTALFPATPPENAENNPQ